MNIYMLKICFFNREAAGLKLRGVRKVWGRQGVIKKNKDDLDEGNLPEEEEKDESQSQTEQVIENGRITKMKEKMVVSLPGVGTPILGHGREVPW